MGGCGSNLETILLQQGVRIKQGVGSGGTWREAFRTLTTILLSLLLPLSFLLLGRLSTARVLAPALLLSDRNYIPTSQPPTSHILSFLFLYCNTSISTILYALLSLITFATFVHGLTGRRLTFSNISRSPAPEPVSDHIFRPRLYAAWIILCTLQVCVGLGIEGSIVAGIDGSRRFMSSSRSLSLSEEGFITNLMTRIIFFVGLHETMHFWSKSVVKPVVDDTVMGFVVKEERWQWFERVGMALSFGALWWWKLRDEVDSLVVVAELKRELQPLLVGTSSAVGVGVADFLGWWLYYLTVTIGTSRLLKGGIGLGMFLLCRRVDATPLSQDRVPHTSICDKV